MTSAPMTFFAMLEESQRLSTRYHLLLGELFGNATVKEHLQRAIDEDEEVRLLIDQLAKMEPDMSMIAARLRTQL